MPSVHRARLDVLRRRPLQRLVAAGAVVGLASGLATIEALAAESTTDADEVKTVRVAAADRVDLLEEPPEPELAGAIRDTLEDRREVLETAVDGAAQEARREAASASDAEAAPGSEAPSESGTASEPEARSESGAAAEAGTASEPEPRPEGAVDLATWERLADCESGGNWSINTGNGFYGGLQFTLDSWQLVGGTGRPHEASKREQIARAEILLERQGWQAWPSCSRQLGLR